MFTMFCACTERGNSSNNNNSDNNNNSNSNNNNTPIGWVLVGDADISGAEAETPILRFHNNVPYIAFIDEPSGARLVRIMKYVAATDTWENVGGSGFSAGSSELAFEINSSTGDLYVAYSDGTNTGKLTVRMFDGSSWDDVGGVIGISTGAVEHVGLTIKGGVTPYVAYYDTSDARVVIKKFVVGAWAQLAAVTLFVDVDSISLASDSNNTYLSTIITSTKLLDVRKYNSSEVESTIAPPTAPQLKDLSGMFNGDYLYITAIDLNGGTDKLALLRYNVVTPGWSNVGTSAYISDGIAGVPSMFVHSNGISDDVVYVAYRDNTVSDKASVKFCLDDPTLDWSTLGALGFSDTSVTGLSLYYDDGHPYVAYINTTTDGIEVRKY